MRRSAIAYRPTLSFFDLSRRRFRRFLYFLTLSTAEGKNVRVDRLFPALNAGRTLYV